MPWNKFVQGMLSVFAEVVPFSIPTIAGYRLQTTDTGYSTSELLFMSGAIILLPQSTIPKKRP